MNRIVILSWTFIFSATILVSIAIAIPYFVINEKLTDSDRKVAAFYYGWYSNSTNYTQSVPYNITDDNSTRHWDLSTISPGELALTNHPIFGLYDSADPFTIEEHLKQAEWAGLDAFIVSYWGKNGVEFQNFINMLEVAKNISSNITLSLYFETGMGGLPEKSESDAVSFLTDELTEIYDTFTSLEYKDYIWYEDNKPVLFAYVVQWLTSNVWEQALKQLEDNGQSFFLVADRPGNSIQYNSLFQATHNYDGYAPTRDGVYFESNVNLKKNAMVYKQLYIAGVHPAYDDTNVREGNVPFGRDNENYYKARWEEAIFMKPDWITITSWNEWHEGTEIEPSVEDGTKALEQTKDYIKEFKTGSYQSLSIQVSYFFEILFSIIALIASWIIFVSYPKLKEKLSPRLRNKLSSKKITLLTGLALFISWLGLVAFIVAEFFLDYLLLFSGSFLILFLPILTFLNRATSDFKNIERK